MMWPFVALSLSREPDHELQDRAPRSVSLSTTPPALKQFLSPEHSINTYMDVQVELIGVSLWGWEMFCIIPKMGIMQRTRINTMECCHCYFSRLPCVPVRTSRSLSAAPAQLLELPVGNLYVNDPIRTLNDFPSTSPANWHSSAELSH